MKFGWVTVSATISTATFKSGPDFQIGIAHHHTNALGSYLIRFEGAGASKKRK